MTCALLVHPSREKLYRARACMQRLVYGGTGKPWACVDLRDGCLEATAVLWNRHVCILLAPSGALRPPAGLTVTQFGQCGSASLANGGGCLHRSSHVPDRPAALRWRAVWGAQRASFVKLHQ